jgi:phospholipase/carboxylesterase
MLIDGPRMPPAAGGKPTSLVVLLHGYGSNGEDLISLAPYWAKALPNTQFVSPNAPERVTGVPGGYQWFPITRLDPHLMEAGVRSAAGGLDRFLDRELERYQLPASKLALVGFSQGTMMSLHVGVRRAKAVAGVVGFSGALAGAAKLKEEVKTKPPILLVHGDRDDMIPAGAMFEAGDALAGAGLSAQWHISYGVPHSIGPDGLQMGGAFLKAALAGKFAATSGLVGA